MGRLHRDTRHSRQRRPRLGIVDRLDRQPRQPRLSRHSGQTRQRVGSSFGSIGHTRLSRHAGELYNFGSLSLCKAFTFYAQKLRRPPLLLSGLTLFLPLHLLIGVA